MDLELAKEFIEHGCPVFKLRRRAKKDWATLGEFIPAKKAWQLTKPDIKELGNFNPIKYGLAVVTGVKFDVIDIDPRNGGKESWQTMAAAKIIPDVKFMVKTPRNGVHLYINRTGMPSRSNIFPGIDLKAGTIDGTGRGFVVFPGTRKYSHDGMYEVHLRDPNAWEMLDKPDKSKGYAPLREILRTQYEFRQQRVSWNNGVYTGPILTEEQVRDVLSFACRQLVDLEASKLGEHSDKLYFVCCTFGGLISGSGLDEQEARQAVLIVAKKMGFEQEYVLEKIERGFAWGKQRPINLFPSFDELGLKGFG